MEDIVGTLHFWRTRATVTPIIVVLQTGGNGGILRLDDGQPRLHGTLDEAQLLQGRDFKMAEPDGADGSGRTLGSFDGRLAVRRPQHVMGGEAEETSRRCLTRDTW